MNAKLITVAVAGLAAAACASTEQSPTTLPDTGVRSGAANAAAATPGSIEDFVETAGERVFFDYDSYALSPQARRTLEAQAAWLQAYDAEILIAGNCDERGTREYNLALGARRANAARDYLVSLGVDPSRITTISYGKERPVDPRSNEQAWSLNRNAHTQIVSDGVVG